MLKTLVLSVAGKPRHELMTFLQSVPGLVLLNAPDGALPVRTEMPNIDLLIFDAYGPPGVRWSLLEAARAKLAVAHCIALVSLPQQMAKARAAGADQVLMTGFSTLQFLEALQAITNAMTDGNYGRWSSDII